MFWISICLFFLFALGWSIRLMRLSKDRDFIRRECERQFHAARWWHDNRETLKRMGVEEHEFQQLRMNQPWAPSDKKGDINPPPDHRKRSTWVDRSPTHHRGLHENSHGMGRQRGRF